MIADANMNAQYDEFLNEIQKKKMRELWDNAEDEVWDEIKLRK